uniref:hypothetical protein n=1 Tax=Klebsiella sp. TaxID=576 RepID=UPI0031CE757A
MSELTAALATIEKLRAERDRLAAENAGLKAALTGNAYISFIKANGWNASASTVNGKFVNFADPEVDFGSMVFAHAKKLIDDIKTPATNAAIAGIKADGAKAAGDYLKLNAQHMPVVERLMMQDAAEICYGTAARLREGAK